MLLPLVGLLLVEGGLRLAGYGETYPLFVPERLADGWVHVNPQVIRRFMVDEEDTPNLWARPVPFRPEKPPGTFRIFVQGGSSAEGYPYGYEASPAGMLQQRLQHTFPDRRIEVITTAMSAVNTYTLLDFSREILAQHPDLIVIYAGHNEYLGILGVGSTFSAGRHRPLVLTFLGLKDMRLLQLGRRALAALTRRPKPKTRSTLMARVVAEERIPYGSELYQRGLEQYRANLRALLHRYEKAGVPVYIGTLVSNERDQKPFISALGEGADAAAWQGHFDAAAAAFTDGAAETALSELDAAVAIDDLDAAGHFARGRVLETLERYDEARDAYLAAKDRDELRFRAPEAINQILREVAEEEGAVVVDVRDAFSRAAPNGIVGKDLMLEHLHPNVEGYFVMADAFYRSLHEHGAIGPWEHPISEEQARQETPVTEVDRLYGEYRIKTLTAGWPFGNGEGRYRPLPAENPQERIAQAFYRGDYPWPDAMRELLDYYRSKGATAEAAKVAALLADAFPYVAEDQQAAAELLQAAGRSDYQVYQRLIDERETAVVAEN